MITIHCGLHKTGSTAIQLAATAVSRRNRPRIHVPTPNANRSDDAWFAHLDASLSHPQAVFSDENLLGTPLDGYLKAEARVQGLSQVLRGRESQIVVYLRPQHSWLPSVFTQATQEGRDVEVTTFLDSTNKSPWLLWSNLVKLLRQSSGASRVVPRVYLPETDVVADFFEVAGLGDVPNFGKSGIRANVSIPAVQIPILKALLDNPDLHRLDAVEIRALFQEVLATGAVTGFSPFSSSQQIKVTERYREDWLILADLVSSNFPLEAGQMVTVARDWPVCPLPHLAEGLVNPLVIREMLRCIGVMASARGVEHSGMRRRVLRKLRTDPRNIPAAVRRALHG